MVERAETGKTEERRTI